MSPNPEGTSSITIIPARHKGEEVFVAGKDKADARRYRNQLVAIAKRHRVSIRFLVEAFGQSLLDLIEISETHAMPREGTSR